MVNNTTIQRLLKESRVQVLSNQPTGVGTLLQELRWSQGTFICNGATPVTVTEPTVTANSLILFGLKTVGGTVGAIPATQTITVGTGFTVAGTASDTSTYFYAVIG